MRDAMALEAAIPDPTHQWVAIRYLRRKGWLQEGRSLATTNPSVLARAAANPVQFLKAAMNSAWKGTV